MVANLPLFRAASGTSVHAVRVTLDDAQDQIRQKRNRYNDIAWQTPRPSGLNYVISDTHDSSLEDSLDYLARKLFAFDLKLLKRQNKLDLKTVSSPDSTEANTAQDRIKAFKDVMEQWESIKNYTSGFASSYLTDKAYIPVWRNALKHIKMILLSKKVGKAEEDIREQYQAILKSYESPASALEEALVSAARQGLLNKDIIKVIRARWLLLEEVVDECYDCYGTVCEGDPLPTRNLSSWHSISFTIQGLTNISHHPRGNGTAYQSTPSMIQHSSTGAKVLQQAIKYPVLLSCLIFLGTTILSIALFAVGYAKSTHERGSIHDADFWFSCQASLAQATGLISSALLTGCMGKNSSWRWCFLAGIASICTVSSAPLYVALQKEWASFSALVGTMLQSICILQQCLFTSEGIVKEKEGKLD